MGENRGPVKYYSPAIDEQGNDNYGADLQRIIPHELFHARTFEDTPVPLNKEFSKTGWNYHNPTSPEGWLDSRSVKPNIATTPYGMTNPSEDIAEYLTLSYLNDENKPVSEEMKQQASSILRLDPKRKRIADKLFNILKSNY
jgi:hypothetical protein